MDFPQLQNFLTILAMKMDIAGKNILQKWRQFVYIYIAL